MDLSFELPPGTYGRLTGRSSTTMRGILVLDGVIDADYRGSVDVMVINFNEEEITVQQGERIAQLIVEKIELPTLEEVKSLTDTDRAEGGFGSTGRC